MRRRGAVRKFTATVRMYHGEIRRFCARVDYLHVTKKARQAAALAAMVDELGDLEQEIAEHKIKFARVEVLRASIRSAYAKADPGRMYQAAGERWVCLVGKNGNASIVDKAELLKRIGAAKFCELAGVTLKALEEHVPKEILGAVVSLEPIGPRIITVVPVQAAES